MNREALPTKLNLGTMGFKHPADRSEFLKALKKSHFKWIRDEAENIEMKNVRYAALTIDLNDPPFEKNVSFRANAERLMETLAEAADAEVRKSVVHSIYANCKALNILLNDEEESIREIAKKRLSGLTNDV